MFNKIQMWLVAGLLALAYILRLQNKVTTQKLQSTKDRLDAQNVLNTTYKKIDANQRRAADRHANEIKAERQKLKKGDRDQLNEEW